MKTTKNRTSKKVINNAKIELVETNRINLIDYDKAKQQILTELYYSTEFKNKLRKIIVDRQINILKSGMDDIFQEVFVELGKKDAEYLFNQYVKNPNSILAIALTIAKTFFLVNPNYPDYPNKSIVHKLNYGSTITGRADWVSPVDSDYEFEDDTLNGLSLSDGREGAYGMEEDYSEEETTVNIINEIKEELTDKEVKAMDYLLNHFNKSKSHTVNYDDKSFIRIMTTHKDLLSKVKGILESKGITNLEDVFKQSR